MSFGIQRTKGDGGQVTGLTWGQNNFTNVAAAQFFGVQENETETPWVIQATLFTPVIPTQTKDLRGTASVTAQFQIGQGNSFYGNGLDSDNFYWIFDGFDNNWNGNNIITPIYKRELQKRYGGYIQGQYYINNQLFMSYVFSFSKAYGVPQTRNQALLNFVPVTNGYEYLTRFDQTRDIQSHDFILWYRPSKNFRFGLGYSYLKTNWFQITTVGSRQTRMGDNHRIQFAGLFFF